jgi:hypothetical protein
MKMDWKKTLLGVGLAALAAVPFVAFADGFNFNVKIGDDNERHYRFREGKVQHNPEMLKAAQLLAEAKNHLWYAKDDWGRHRDNAVQHINMALDEISATENNWRNDNRRHDNRRNDNRRHDNR